MSEVKRQHHVPRTYLKHFAEQEKEDTYRIHAVEPGKTPFPTNITNVCVKKDMYTPKGETVEERMLIEKFYSDTLESQYNRAYNILIDPERKRITAEERSLIISTVFTMFYRTFRWINLQNTFFDEIIARGYESCIAMGKDKFFLEDREVSIKGKTLEDLQKEFREEGKSAQIFIQLDVALKLIKLRKNDGISVVKIEDEAELITSDQPVVMSNLKGGILAPFDPTNLVELPLDAKHKLIIQPRTSYADPTLVVRDFQKGKFAKLMTFTSNCKQFETIDKHLLGSLTGLTEFEKHRENIYKPISKDEYEQLTDLNSIMKKMEELGLF